METWQEVLKQNSIRSLDMLAAKFGNEQWKSNEIEKFGFAFRWSAVGAAVALFVLNELTRQ